mmetsp:Transcript_8428/g.20989  ORF Transcript_8428/g.20989 Transcript_8428/m.20989 type:complete len:247 (-) Transcript_8428:689-1429(-)
MLSITVSTGYAKMLKKRWRCKAKSTFSHRPASSSCMNSSSSSEVGSSHSRVPSRSLDRSFSPGMYQLLSAKSWLPYTCSFCPMKKGVSSSSAKYALPSAVRMRPPRCTPVPMTTSSASGSRPEVSRPRFLRRLGAPPSPSSSDDVYSEPSSAAPPRLFPRPPRPRPRPRPAPRPPAVVARPRPPPRPLPRPVPPAIFGGGLGSSKSRACLAAFHPPAPPRRGTVLGLSSPSPSSSSSSLSCSSSYS